MNRHEAATLWQIVLAIRRKNFFEAEAMARTLLRASLAEFTKEDAATTTLEKASNDQ